MTAPRIMQRIAATIATADRERAERARHRGPNPGPRWLPPLPRTAKANPRRAYGPAARAVRGHAARIFLRLIIAAGICYAAATYLPATPVTGAIQAAAIAWWLVTTAHSRLSTKPEPKPKKPAAISSGSENSEPEETQ